MTHDVFTKIVADNIPQVEKDSEKKNDIKNKVAEDEQVLEKRDESEFEYLKDESEIQKMVYEVFLKVIAKNSPITVETEVEQDYVLVSQ